MQALRGGRDCSRDGAVLVDLCKCGTWTGDERRRDGVRMAMRNKGIPRQDGGAGTDPSGATSADAIEQRVMAFAEQVGRIAGTLQAKAEGWMQRETLHTQIASVRDRAADLLEQLAGSVTTASTETPTAAKVRRHTPGRSGGVVDAPGKTHRKPTPRDPDASMVDSQAAKMRAAATMTKTNRRRGRG
jgi:hypothetical protein